MNRILSLVFILISLLFLSAAPLTAQSPSSPSITQPTAPVRVSDAGIQPAAGPLTPSDPLQINLVTETVALALLALSPYIIMLLTCFTKMIIVLSLFRNAIGAQTTPPNQILNGVALILTMFVMFPTMLAMYSASKDAIDELPKDVSILSGGSAKAIIKIADQAKEPLRLFLMKHTEQAHKKMFFTMAFQTLPPEYHEMITPEHFAIVIPSFITSQIKNAFEIAVLIYLPFFVIDLVTSNILLAMGMQMLSPMTISLPLKLLLLVMIDGWTLIMQGLALSYL